MPSPIFAQGQGFTPYAWTDADLALIYPAGWELPVPGGDDIGADTDAQRRRCGGVTLVVLPASTTDEALRPALERQLTAAIC